MQRWRSDSGVGVDKDGEVTKEEIGSNGVYVGLSCSDLWEEMGVLP